MTTMEKTGDEAASASLPAAGSPPSPQHAEHPTPQTTIAATGQDSQCHPESSSAAVDHIAQDHSDEPRAVDEIQTVSDIEDNVISFRSVDPVDVRARNISVQVDSSPPWIQQALAAIKKGRTPGKSRTKAVKPILEDVSADFPRGTLTAILGASGSGKTSFLNVMARRMHGSRLHISGSALFNGNESLSSVRNAYVMQQDVLIPTLTVRETLQYAADLRLPASVSKSERKSVVEEVIKELGLKDAASTRIGNSAHRGCSGGEKRRVSIGIQLLANPSVIFLDEPTTGLDASTAQQLVRTLKNLAKAGRTIIMTIHQPRSEIWHEFDNVVLLSKGVTAYSGPAEGCIPWFASNGHPLPPLTNPAEHVIDLIAIDTRSPELEAVSSERVDALKQAWKKNALERQSKDILPPPAISSGPEQAAREKPASFFRQTWVLTHRTVRTTVRDSLGMLGSLVEAISMAIITGWIFYQLDGSLAGIRSRQGAIYTAAALQGYLILLFETYRLSEDIQVFDRERSEGIVGVPQFLISRRIARILIEDIPVPLIFSLIFYFMAGFETDGEQFMTFFGVILLEQYIAVTFAMLCIGVSRHFATASLVANMAYTLQSMACGYFVQRSNIPPWTRWTTWTAYVFYAFGALCSNEFAGKFYSCPYPGGIDNPACKEYSGDYVLNALGFPGNWLWRPIIVLLGFVCAFYLGAGVILRFWRVEMQVSRARGGDDADKSAGKETLTARSLHEIRTVAIGLQGYALTIEKRKWLGGKPRKLEIIKPVSADFRPGVLNVVMGPSGSGKTTLLNSMAQRLKDDVLTKYSSEGTMTFNGCAISPDAIQSTCSFVTQDDDALLASLTVRETLRFAAGLRLPSNWSKEKKMQKAEEVLLKMGLKDCADNLVGNDMNKGISGGEKRRVTIAVQILTDPHVLMLDEPTSGLDAFTAASILDVLRGLAEEGRTVVLTIHQARSDLFPHFGNILLLARGGSPVFSGPASEMLPHFRSKGHECPQDTNPADFALDLITVDLRHERKEQATRRKVRSLIDSWNSESFARLQLPQETAQISLPAELGSFQKHMAKLSTSLPLVLKRAWLNQTRQPDLVMGRIMQNVGFAIILALYFAPLKNDYFSVQTRLGYVQEIAPLYFIGMLQNVAVYPNERDVFYREYDDRAYSVEAFLLQYTLIESAFTIVTALIFPALTVMAVGLHRTAQMYFIMAFNDFCIISCGESLGIMFNTLFEHTGFSVNVTSVILSIAQIMGGTMSLNIPGFLQAFNWLSPVKYSVANLANYSLRGVQFTCNDFQRLPNGDCPIRNGEQVLQQFNLDFDANTYLMGLGVCTIVYRLVAYGVLKAARERWLVRAWRRARRRSP